MHERSCRGGSRRPCVCPGSRRSANPTTRLSQRRDGSPRSAARTRRVRCTSRQELGWVSRRTPAAPREARTRPHIDALDQARVVPARPHPTSVTSVAASHRPPSLGAARGSLRWPLRTPAVAESLRRRTAASCRAVAQSAIDGRKNPAPLWPTTTSVSYVTAARAALTNDRGSPLPAALRRSGTSASCPDDASASATPRHVAGPTSGLWTRTKRTAISLPEPAAQVAVEHDAPAFSQRPFTLGSTPPRPR